MYLKLKIKKTLMQPVIVYTRCVSFKRGEIMVEHKSKETSNLNVKVLKPGVCLVEVCLICSQSFWSFIFETPSPFQNVHVLYFPGMFTYDVHTNKCSTDTRVRIHQHFKLKIQKYS